MQHGSPSPSSNHVVLKPVLDTVFAFSPNRDTLGGTSYFLQTADGNVLVDCPSWNNTTQDTLQKLGGIRWLVLTHRGGVGKLAHVKQIQSHFQCDVLVQEQEAYLLPDIPVTSFQHIFQIDPNNRMIWTPGHTPGSACFYHQLQGGSEMNKGVLFTGRHLLPDRQGNAQPLRVSKTFHWFRQLRSIQILRDSFTEHTLHFGCPGANTSLLRQQRVISNFYQQLVDLDLESLRGIQPGL